MKDTVTDLKDPKESVMFSRSILDNFFFETFFSELEVKISPLADSYEKYEIPHSNQISELNYTLVDHSNDASIDSSTCKLVDFSHCTLVNSGFTSYCKQLTTHNLSSL